MVQLDLKKSFKRGVKRIVNFVGRAKAKKNTVRAKREHVATIKWLRYLFTKAVSYQ